MKRNPFFKIILFVVALVGLYGAWHVLPVQEWSLEFGHFAEKQGRLGVFIYGLLFVLATIFLFPGAFLTFAAGVAYGAWGLPLILLSTCIGSTISFIIARHFAKDEVTRYMEKYPATKALKAAIETEGWKFMILLRISPLIPFNLNSYFLGTVKVRFFTYFWVTLAGALPGTLLFVYLGSIGRNIQEEGNLKWFVLALGALATYLLGNMTLRKTREFLRQSSETT